MINLLEKRYDAPKYVLWCVFMVLVLSGMIAGDTKIYNVVSLTCFINGRWDDSNKYVGIHERAQTGDVEAQVDLGWHYVSGACVSPSAKRRRIGLQWMQKAAQNDPSLENVGRFYQYARLHVSEEPSFLPVANRLVMNAVEDAEDNWFAAELNKTLRLHKAIIQCERGEQEWQQCRKIMRDATEEEYYQGRRYYHYGQWYYAEILARGLGGDVDSDRAVEIIDKLIANEVHHLPELGAVTSIEAMLVHKENLFLSNQGMDFNLSDKKKGILSEYQYNQITYYCRQNHPSASWLFCIFWR